MEIEFLRKKKFCKEEGIRQIIKQQVSWYLFIRGRRVEKNVDGYKTRYIYDGGNVIAEYDGNGNLTRKYIHGAGVDELVCMIDVADSNAFYYYHYDALGSVVALSDSSGDSCQSYEYSVYGQVAASDPNFTANPYLFTGRRFDYETGLYYYRARYYNPYIGRFLQTDPIGYGDGINWYAYCGNNPIVRADPSGLAVDWTWYGHFKFLPLGKNKNVLTFQYLNASGEKATINFNSFDKWETWALGYFQGRENEMAGSVLAGDNIDLFWELQKMAFLCRKVGGMLDEIDTLLTDTNQTVTITDIRLGRDRYYYGTNTLQWNNVSRGIVNFCTVEGVNRKWHRAPANVGLAHELRHCLEDLRGIEYIEAISEPKAMLMENNLRYSYFERVPKMGWIYPRPGIGWDSEDLGWGTAGSAWRSYWKKCPFPVHFPPYGP